MGLADDRDKDGAASNASLQSKVPLLASCLSHVLQVAMLAHTCQALRRELEESR
jgi:hypothetical protein